MKNKPLVFIILGVLHILEPLFKLLYFKASTHFDWPTIMSNISQINSPKGFFEFWLLFPLGGLALLGVKRWSYPIFVGVQTYSIYAHLTYEKFTWPYVSETPHFSSLIILAFNVLVIMYFLFPEVRRPFFDEKVRWWENRNRHACHLSCYIKLPEHQEHIMAHILNLSPGGFFIDYHDPKLEIGTMVDVEFVIERLNLSMSLKGMLVSLHTFNNQSGIGVKVQFRNIWEKYYMRKITRFLSKQAQTQEEIKSAA